jgi:hypothetical protein
MAKGRGGGFYTTEIAAGNAAAEESHKEGCNYWSGLMAPKYKDKEEVGNGEGKTWKKLVVGCGKCGKSDHKTTRWMKCYYSTNTKSVFYTGIKETVLAAAVLSSVVEFLHAPTPGIPTSESIPNDAQTTTEPISCLPSTCDSMSCK